MKVQQIEVSKLTPYAKNPRKNDKAVDVVANSLEQYGFQQPIVVDKDYVIVVGHTRFRAAKKLGYTQVPVVVADDLDDKKVQAYRIMDNRSNENAQWDDELLYQELNDLISGSSVQELSFETGFTESELEKLFRDDDNDVIQNYLKGEERKSRVGDVWVLGDHKIMHGDSTNAEHYKILLGDEKIDLLWEDPPYGIEYETPGVINMTEEQKRAEKERKIANDNLSGEELDAFLRQHMLCVNDYLRKGASVYWSHDIRFTQSFRDILEHYGIHITDTLIWRKNNVSTWMTDYGKIYEPILYGWKEGAEHRWFGKGMQYNAFTLDELESKSREDLIDIIKSLDINYQEIKKESNKNATLHPTVKPTKLIAYHIINSSKVGEIVFDGFSGSGATIMACEKTGRIGRGIEFEAKYVDTIVKRWQDETGGIAKRESDGVEWDDAETYHE
jgi:ParB/RepB/Spo0J family partition protein